MDAELRGLRGVDTAALTRLAEAVFGRGERPAGWLARKLAREGVDPDVSVLAVTPGSEKHVQEDMLLGYFLIGQEPGDPVAHSAGLGVAARARGSGLGRALVEAAAARLAGGEGWGARSKDPRPAILRVLAEPEREGFYARLGFAVAARHVTLLTHGTCPISPLDHARDLEAHPPAPWSPPPMPDDALEVCGWRAGVWARTPGGATIEPLPGAWAHVSREGRALLVQRLVVAPGLDPRTVVDALVARTPIGAPLLLYGAAAVSSITARLLQRGLQPAQRFAAMDRPLTRLDSARAGDR